MFFFSSSSHIHCLCAHLFCSFSYRIWRLSPHSATLVTSGRVVGMDAERVARMQTICTLLSCCVRGYQKHIAHEVRTVLCTFFTRLASFSLCFPSLVFVSMFFSFFSLFRCSHEPNNNKTNSNVFTCSFLLLSSRSSPLKN